MYVILAISYPIISINSIAMVAGISKDVNDKVTFQHTSDVNVAQRFGAEVEAVVAYLNKEASCNAVEGTHWKFTIGPVGDPRAPDTLSHQPFADNLLDCVQGALNEIINTRELTDVIRENHIKKTILAMNQRFAGDVELHVKYYGGSNYSIEVTRHCAIQKLRIDVVNNQPAFTAIKD